MEYLLGMQKDQVLCILFFWITPMKVFNLQKLLYRYTSSFCSVEVFVFVIESSQTPGISFKEAVIEPGQLEIYFWDIQIFNQILNEQSVNKEKW